MLSKTDKADARAEYETLLAAWDGKVKICKTRAYRGDIVMSRKGAGVIGNEFLKPVSRRRCQK